MAWTPLKSLAGDFNNHEIVTSPPLRGAGRIIRLAQYDWMDYGGRVPTDMIQQGVRRLADDTDCSRTPSDLARNNSGPTNHGRR